MIDASAFIPGLLTSFALIAAIGPQNAFVIRQGLTRKFVFEVALISTALDATLVLLGVAGLGVLIASVPLLIEVIRWFGVGYLVWFGIGSLRRVFAPEAMSLVGDTAATRRTIVLSTISFSLFNPHVYLDTVIFLGSIANQYGDSRWWFALGACLASAVWFFAIAYGARSLARYVTSRRFWQVLDTVIALTMFTIAGFLAFTPLS
jgi:L-lysine exporter family protein LysE/ArgO